MRDLRIGANEQIEVYSDSEPEHKFGTLETDAGFHLSFCRDQDGLLVNLDDDNELDRIMTEVLKRRNAQDAEHGGPEHDDTHTEADWIGFITKFKNRADQHRIKEDIGAYQDCLVDVAALAIAALASSRRKCAEIGRQILR